MKISFISLMDYNTSSGRRIFFLAKELVKRGHTVDFLTFAWQYQKGSKKAKNSNIDGVNIKYIYVKKNILSILFRGTFGLIKHMKADYYIINKALPIHAIPFLIAKKFKKGKLIYDSDDWEGIGGSAILKGIPFSKRMAVTFLEEYIPRKSNAVFACSNVLVKRHEDMGVKKVLFVPNVATKDSFKFNEAKRKELRKKYGVKDNEYLFVHMGMYDTPMDEKSISQFIRAVSKIKEKNFKIMLIGNGKYTDKIKSTIKKLKMNNKVILTGKIEYQYLADYLSTADIAFVPQLIDYPFTLILMANNPRKMYEFMSMGLPVTASRIGELEYAIKDSRMLFSPKNEEEIISKIQGILKMSKNELKKIGLNNKQRIKSEFNFEVQAKKIEDFLKIL